MCAATSTGSDDRASGHGDAPAVALPRRERRLGTMTWASVRAALDRGCDRVVVPFGAVEQHGCHLPLETDALLGAVAELGRKLGVATPMLTAVEALTRLRCTPR